MYQELSYQFNRIRINELQQEAEKRNKEREYLKQLKRINRR